VDSGAALMSAARACASSAVAFAVSTTSTCLALEEHPTAPVASAAITNRRLDRIKSVLGDQRVGAARIASEAAPGTHRARGKPLLLDCNVKYAANELAELPGFPGFFVRK
jgi:hypothetical protein